MAIVRVGGTYYASGSTDPFSISSVDIGTAAGRCVLVFVYRFSGSGSPTGATYAGEALTAGVTGTNSLGGTFPWALYYKVGVTATGSNSVSVSTGAPGSTYVAIAATYTGVGSVRGTAGDDRDSGSQPSVTITTVSGDLVVLLGADSENGSTFTASSPATAFTTTGAQYGAEETASTTSTTIDGTLSVGSIWSAGAFALVEAITTAAEQEGARFGNDDAAEAAHTWAAAQDTNITAPAGQTRVLNMIVNATGTIGAKTFKLQYRKVGDGAWRDVPVQ